ncbi:hypothetical protein D3C71_1848640 [compost metagenome]
MPRLFSSGISACNLWQYGQVVSVNTVMCDLVSPMAGYTTVSATGMSLTSLEMPRRSVFSVKLTGLPSLSWNM